MGVSRDITIAFIRERGALEDHYLSVGLDNDANEGKLSFNAGETVYLKVYYNSSYVYESSGGTINEVATDIPLEVVDEYVIFANGDVAYLAYVPSSSVSYTWVGKDAGNPVFTGRKIILSDPSVAVLKCSYTTQGDRLSLKFNEEGQVVVVVTLDNAESEVSTTVFFTEGAGEDPVSYRIGVTDYCSDAALIGVSVTITRAGDSVPGETLTGGITDANGEVYLGMLIPGRQYNLKMTKAGYLDSDIDILNNDYFIA